MAGGNIYNLICIVNLQTLLFMLNVTAHIKAKWIRLNAGLAFAASDAKAYLMAVDRPVLEDQDKLSMGPFIICPIT